MHGCTEEAAVFYVYIYMLTYFTFLIIVLKLSQYMA